MINYKLSQSPYIVENQDAIIEQCLHVKNNFGNKDTTWSYNEYNIFAITAGSVYFYNIFKELRDIIKTELPKQTTWMQAWLNVHDCDKVLDWHNHDWDYHGYISIDPKNTTTDFEEYSITNKVGQIYFGSGYKLHKVNVIEPFSDKRITIGYDVTTDPIMDTGCYGLIPIV